MPGSWLLTVMRRYERMRLAGQVPVRKIAKHLTARLPAPSRALRQIDPRSVRVAAIQWPLAWPETVEDYCDLLVRWLRPALDQGAQLVVFPELTAMPLLATLPKTTGLADVTTLTVPIDDTLPDPALISLIDRASAWLSRMQHAIFEHAARLAGVYIQAGSSWVPAPDRQRVIHAARLYGPDGRFLLERSKSHLAPYERRLGIAADPQAPVAETLLGRIGVMVGHDLYYWESARILFLLGAQLVLVPFATVRPFNPIQERTGLWARVQENPVYGIKAAAVGHLFGYTFQGKSGIYGPAGVGSVQAGGVLASAEDPLRPDVITARLDLPALHAYQRQLALEQGFNPDLYERYFPELYQRLAKRIRERRKRPRLPQRD